MTTKPRALAIEDLPTGLRGVRLADAESDARHLGELIGAAMNDLQSLIVKEPEEMAALNRASAMLWVARDLAEVLEWRLDRMERHREGAVE